MHSALSGKKNNRVMLMNHNESVQYMKSKPALNTIDDQAMKDSFIGSVKMPQKKIKKKEMKMRK